MSKHEENLKRIKRFRLMDDSFMSVVFDNRPELTEFVLKIILDRDDIRVISVKTQYALNNLRGRSSRLDIFAEDNDGKKYNIEVQ